MTVDTSIAAMPGTPGELLCVLVDISELKRAEDIRIRASALEAENRQLLEAARARRAFLANMSHELYTPLNAIIGYSHLLGTGAIAPESPRFAKYLGDIGASGQQLLAQVQSVLAFTDAESGRFELRPQRVELRDVLQNVVDVVQAGARARRGVALAMEPAAGDPHRSDAAVAGGVAHAVQRHPLLARGRARHAARAGAGRARVPRRGGGLAASASPRRTCRACSRRFAS